MVNTGPAGQVLHLWVIYIMFGWLLKCCRVHGWLSEQFCVSWCEEADEAAVNSNISLRVLSSSTIHVLKNLRWTHLSAGSEIDRFDIFRALRRNMKDIFVKILTPVETFQNFFQQAANWKPRAVGSSDLVIERGARIAAALLTSTSQAALTLCIELQRRLTGDHLQPSWWTVFNRDIRQTDGQFDPEHLKAA